MSEGVEEGAVRGLEIARHRLAWISFGDVEREPAERICVLVILEYHGGRDPVRVVRTGGFARVSILEGDVQKLHGRHHHKGRSREVSEDRCGTEPSDGE